jgi:hypothetical protein
MKKRINHTRVTQILSSQGLTYRDVQEISADKIKLDTLKKILPRGGHLTVYQINILAQILDCSENEIVDQNENISDNLPPFIDPIASRLFFRIKNSHRVVYQYYTKARLNSESYRNRYGQANRILNAMTSNGDIYEPQATDSAIKLIIDCLSTENALSDILNMFTAYDRETLMKLLAESENSTQEQRLLLLFFYVHVIFYTIFLDDLIASILEHSIERKSKNFITYKDLAIRNEVLHLTLKNKILYSTTGLSEIDSDPTMNMKQHLVDSTLLMLTACKKSGEVITSDYRNSLCLDDSEFDAILTHLETTFENIGIKTIAYTQYHYSQSPFYFAYENIQKGYMSKIEERKIAEENRKTEQEKTKQMGLIFAGFPFGK